MQLKLRNFNVGILFLLIVMFSCQSSDENIFPFREKAEDVTFNVFKNTQIQPTVGHTYLFKNNGDFYIFEYNIGNAISEIRHAEIKDFYKPYSWKIKGDSVLIENKYYHFRRKSKNEIILSKKNYDTLLLKKHQKTLI